MPTLLHRASDLIRFANRLSSLGLFRVDRWRIRAHIILMPILERVGVRNVRLRLAAAPDGYVVRDRSDYIVLDETLIANDFDLDLGAIRTVVDLGAHAGAFTIRLRLLYPDAQFLCVEPSRTTYERLVSNVGHFHNVETINAAVDNEDGFAAFVDEPLSWGSHLSESGSEVVRTVTLATLREHHRVPGIDLLKVDIEGGEWSILRSDRDLVGVNQVLGELHGGTPNEFFARFQSFEGRAISDFGHACLFRLKRR